MGCGGEYMGERFMYLNKQKQYKKFLLTGYQHFARQLNEIVKWPQMEECFPVPGEF